MILIWHLGGLLAAAVGAGLLGGWPASLLVLGVWAMLGTLFDIAMNK